MDTLSLYTALTDVLTRAEEQAASGKGADRHADGRPFEDQPIMRIAQAVGIGFPAGQAIKKTQEAVCHHKEHPERSVADLLGAINYIAATIIYIEADHAKTSD